MVKNNSQKFNVFKTRMSNFHKHQLPSKSE